MKKAPQCLYSFKEKVPFRESVGSFQKNMPNSQLTNAKYTLGLFSVQKIRVKLRSPRNSSPNKIAPYEACIQINNTVDNFKPSAQLYGIVSFFLKKINIV